MSLKDILLRLRDIMSSPYRNNRRISTLLKNKWANLKSKNCSERKRINMSTLKMTELREIILRVYEDGNRGCLDLKESYVDEFIQNLLVEMSKKKLSDDWRIYTVEELRKKPLGTLFEHSKYGKGWIDGTEKIKIMTFEQGRTFYITDDGHPWDETMREVGKL